MKQILSIFLICTLMSSCAPDNVVETVNGKVAGYENSDKSILIFKGIPFAAPPVGTLRWKAPQPVINWNGILDCKEYSASPIQNKPEPFLCWTEEFIAQPEPLSEDCLYLNIWTDAHSMNEKKPVFVWIYGGGFSSGSANCAIYDGEEMAKKGVVFVSINYRVGVLGFMAHPELSKESGYNASGNYGFLDQIAALQWIQKNIHAFGGDPGNVTIAGQSAGAFSVTAMITSTLAKGLFAKAIPQSGGLLSNRLMDNLKNSEERGMQFMNKANVSSLEELRRIPASEIQTLGNDPELGRFGVTLDNYVLPDQLLEYYKKGLHNQVPLLAGWVTGDGALFGTTNTTVAQLREEIELQYGSESNEFFSVFPTESDEDAREFKNKMALLNFGGMPAHLMAVFNTKQSYLYQFSHVPPDKPDFPNYGAFHTSEVPFCLHTLHKWDRNWNSVDLNLEEQMSSYWTNFAKTGDPNSEDLPEWKEYQKESGYIMGFGDEAHLTESLFKKEFDFLSKYR